MLCIVIGFASSNGNGSFQGDKSYGAEIGSSFIVKAIPEQLQVSGPWRRLLGPLGLLRIVGSPETGMTTLPSPFPLHLRWEDNESHIASWTARAYRSRRGL